MFNILNHTSLYFLSNKDIALVLSSLMFLLK
nr:MAG TPA: hypothetical protein [Caudoviricetes sp.]